MSPIGGFSSLEEAISDFHNLKIRSYPSNFIHIFLFSHQLGGDYYVVSIDEKTYPIFHLNDEIWLQSIQATLHFQPEEIYLYPLYVRSLTGLGRTDREWDDIRLACYKEGRSLLRGCLKNFR